MKIMKKYENNYKHSELTKTIIAEAYQVHNSLVYGFLEKIYENALFKRLSDANMIVKQQIPINVYFEGIIIGEFYAHLFVEAKIIVELKAVEVVIPVHTAQLLSYLKLTKKPKGLLINFNCENITDNLVPLVTEEFAKLPY